MDNAVFLASQQRIAEVQPQLQNVRVLIIRTKNLRQRLQQLHANVNVPANAVAVLHALHIVARYDIFAAAQILCQGVLADQLLHLIFEVRGNIFRVEGLSVQLLNLSVVLRYGQLFQCALLHPSAGQDALDLINPAEAALADLAHDLPARETDAFIPGGFFFVRRLLRWGSARRISAFLSYSTFQTAHGRGFTCQTAYGSGSCRVAGIRLFPPDAVMGSRALVDFQT